jgi:hypothetical protein
MARHSASFIFQPPERVVMPKRIMSAEKPTAASCVAACSVVTSTASFLSISTR